MNDHMANDRGLAVSRTTRILLGGIVAALGMFAPATARPVTVLNQGNPDEVSSFALDFGPALGGIASSQITHTDYELEVDSDAGTARYAGYYQEVEPLTLPGGISTGNIIVEVVDGSSTGTYDPSTGAFDTEETYAIHFDGDLSAYGLESPVLLSSASSGMIALDAFNGGTIGMDWAGSSSLRNPFDPNTEIGFSYTCTVNTVFAAQPDMLLRVALIPDLANLSLVRRTEFPLMSRLRRAADLIDGNRAGLAANTLRSFIHTVSAFSGNRLSDDDAAWLIEGANATIDLLRADGGERLYHRGQVRRR